MSESRAEFFRRIRRALGNAPEPRSPELDLSIARLASDESDLAALFEERAAEVGIRVHRVGVAGLAGAIAELMRSIGARRVSLGLAPGELRNAAEQAMRESDVERADDPFDADAGITDVACALAETGTLVIAADRERPRCPSLVPPIHVAIVRERDLVADLLDFVATAGEAWPSCTVFVTGPSKTADIEGELVHGVHGPREVVSFLVTET